MTHEPDDRQSLTPAQEERVRRLLAEARHLEPIPPEVSARLEATLADLVAEGAPPADSVAADAGAADPAPVGSAAGTAPVVDLAARRRRRRMTQVLVAAVAVTVVGVAGPQLLNGAGEMMDATSGADSAAGGDADAESAPNAAAEDDQEDSGTDGELSGGERSGGTAAKARLPVEEDAFLRSAARLQPRVEISAYGSPYLTGPADTSSCQDGADWGAGRGVPVSYDGADGVLVFRAPAADGQRVDLFLCGETSPARTAVLPPD